MNKPDFNSKQQFFTELYEIYYSEEKRAEQERIWQVLCNKYFSNFVPQVQSGVMVDIAAGYCNFINNIKAPNYTKYAFDLNEKVADQASDGVIPIVDEIANLKQHFVPNSVDLFFQSHFLEHISKEEILQLMKAEYELLKPKGQMWILTPNIRYYKGGFWDWFDHITPLTERSLIEAAQLVGFKPIYVVPKFIPGSHIFTKKPTYSWIISLYLKLMPLSGQLFGTQSFIILQKD